MRAEATPVILPVSASNRAAFHAHTRALAARLDAVPAASLPAFAAERAMADGAHPHRGAVFGADPAALAAALRALEPTRIGAAPPTLAFLFTGQGAQHAGMATALYARFPVFRAEIDRCAAALAPVPLRELLLTSDRTGRIDRTGAGQPALFAFELAAAALWRSFGLAPAAVLGHSVGELAAACVAGVLSVEDGLRLVAARGALMEALPAGGAMAAVGVAEAEAERTIAFARDRVSIAAINADDQVVLSGDAEAVNAALAAFADQGRVGQRLPVSHAFHSHRMDPVLDPFRAVVAGLPQVPPHTPMGWAASGGLVEGGLVGEDWVAQLRAPVRFGASVRAVAALGVTAWVEVGPAPALLGFVARAGLAGERVSTHRRGRGAEVLLEGLGRLYTLGAPVSWGGVG